MVHLDVAVLLGVIGKRLQWLRLHCRLRLIRVARWDLDILPILPRTGACCGECASLGSLRPHILLRHLPVPVVVVVVGAEIQTSVHELV